MGSHALHLNGAVDVDARGNRWGGADPAVMIHDRTDDPGLGVVAWQPAMEPGRKLSVLQENW